MLRWFEHSQIYFPTRALHAQPREVAPSGEDVHFTAEDGTRLHAWFFGGKEEGSWPRVFLVCHGNGGNISHRLDLYELLLGLECAVLAFDYRGYGQSEGRPSEEGTYQDARAAYDWLRSRGYLPQNILLLGESLGGAVACDLAARRTVGGLVLQSTFTSLPAIGAEVFPWLPVKWIATVEYDSLSKIRALSVPVLILHSREDRLIGFHHAEKLFAAANAPKLLRELAGDHNDGLADGEEAYREGLVEFLRLVSAAREPEPSPGEGGSQPGGQ